MHAPEYNYEPEIQPEDVEKHRVNQDLKLLNLGATIVAFGMAQKVCQTTGDEIYNFTFDQDARHEYSKFLNEIKLLKIELLNKFPEWNSLIDNYFRKAWQLIFNVAPNIKRFNLGVDLFLKRTKDIYPNIKLDELTRILGNDVTPEQLLQFAKVFYYNLPKGYEYAEKLSYGLDDLLDPTVKNLKTGVLEPLSLASIFGDGFVNCDIELIARMWDMPFSASATLGKRDLRRACSVVRNSCHSFGLILTAFQIKGLGEPIEVKAKKAQAATFLSTSRDRHGVEFRITNIIEYLESHGKKGDTVSSAKIKRHKSTLKNVDDNLLNEILATMHQLGYLSIGTETKKKSVNHEIVKIPGKHELLRIVNAVNA